MLGFQFPSRLAMSAACLAACGLCLANRVSSNSLRRSYIQYQALASALALGLPSPIGAGGVMCLKVMGSPAL